MPCQALPEGGLVEEAHVQIGCWVRGIRMHSEYRQQQVPDFRGLGKIKALEGIGGHRRALDPSEAIGQQPRSSLSGSALPPCLRCFDACQQCPLEIPCCEAPSSPPPGQRLTPPQCCGCHSWSPPCMLRASLCLRTTIATRTFLKRFLAWQQVRHSRQDELFSGLGMADLQGSSDMQGRNRG